MEREVEEGGRDFQQAVCLLYSNRLIELAPDVHTSPFLVSGHSALPHISAPIRAILP